MRTKHCWLLLGCAALLACGGTALAGENKPSPGSAEYYKLQPEKFADKKIGIEVCFLRAFDRKSPIPELKFLHAMTYDKKNDLPGGAMVIVIPAEDLEKMIKKYGSFPDGGRPWSWDSKKLEGAFRVAPRGHFYLDVSGKAAALIKDRDLLLEPAPPWPGKGRGMLGGKGGSGGNGGGQVPQPAQTPSKS